MTKVEPSVEKGRSPEVSLTGGAPIPPKAPVKVWTFVPEAAAVAVATAAAVVVASAPTAETAWHASVAAASVADAATTAALVVVTAGAVEDVPETPRAALKASAAA